MAVNNEIETINDLKSISSIAQNMVSLFFVMASQAVGRIHIDFEELGITLLAFTSYTKLSVDHILFVRGK